MIDAPRPIADYGCRTGEGPLYHPEEHAVYWTDIPNGRLFRLSLDTGEHHPIYQGPQVGGMTLQADGSLLLFRERGNIALWRDGVETVVREEIEDERETRFNDVIADPEGRVFCGTMATADRRGRLYRLDPDGQLTRILDGIGCSNGMGFTPDLRNLYYIDTTERAVYRFDYERETGELTNQIVFIRTPEGEGAPDGMTVDAEGYLWVAFWDGSRFVRYSPDGQEVFRQEMPVRKVSCVAFGGQDYDEMFITTAGGDQKGTDGEHAGALFRWRPPVRGVAEFRSRLGLR